MIANREESWLRNEALEMQLWQQKSMFVRNRGHLIFTYWYSNTVFIFYFLFIYSFILLSYYSIHSLCVLFVSVFMYDNLLVREDFYGLIFVIVCKCSQCYILCLLNHYQKAAKEKPEWRKKREKTEKCCFLQIKKKVSFQYMMCSFPLWIVVRNVFYKNLQHSRRKKTIKKK